MWYRIYRTQFVHRDGELLLLWDLFHLRYRQVLEQLLLLYQCVPFTWVYFPQKLQDIKTFLHQKFLDIATDTRLSKFQENKPDLIPAMTMSRRFFGLFRPFSTLFATFFTFPHSKPENILETHEPKDKTVGFSCICGHHFSKDNPNRIKHQKHQFGPFDDLFSGSSLSIQIYSRNWLSSMSQSMWLGWETNGKCM